MTKPQTKPSRSRAGWSMFITAQAIKLGAAALAFHEATGAVRPEGLGFAAFLLTVAQSLESTSNSLSGGKQ